MKMPAFARLGFALGFGALSVTAPQQLTSQAWAQQGPQDLGGYCPTSATDYRGTNGTFTCGCPSNMTQIGSVWGSDTYTDDSSICRAAVHAGVISAGGGQVIFSVLGGRATYQGSTRNGVSSSNFGHWQGSFQFGQSIVAKPTGVASCPANAQSFRGSNGVNQFTCSCSASDVASGSVWGWVTYTDDSRICRAALQLGLVGNQGGDVTVTIVVGQSSYQGATSNGVTSSSYGPYAGSFQLGAAQ